MRASKKLDPRSITRRDPVPRYGATLDIFDGLDENDPRVMLEHLDAAVVGWIRLPGQATMSFRSRDEYLAAVGPVMAGLRAARIRLKTKITHYDATADSSTVLASVVLDRIWDVDGARTHLRGHATIVWAKHADGPKIVQWRVTWEPAREQSGDWPR